MRRLVDLQRHVTSRTFSRDIIVTVTFTGRKAPITFTSTILQHDLRRLHAEAVIDAFRPTCPSMQRTPPAKVKYVSAYLKTAPSTTPQEAMDARQQAHINELTEQLRTTEHMSKKLREELAQAQAQMKAERASALEQRLKEAQAWKAGTELTKAMFQVTQARLLLLLDVERRDVLSREDDVRKERLARARRDYHLLLFQERENELEERIIEMHETLDVEREEREKGDQEYEGLRRRFEEVAGKYGKLKAKYSTLLAKGTEMQRDLEQSGAKRSEMEVRARRRPSVKID